MKLIVMDKSQWFKKKLLLIKISLFLINIIIICTVINVNKRKI